MKRLLPVFAALGLVALLLTACAPVVPQAAPAAGEGAGVTVIRVGTGDSGAGLDPHQQIIQAFEDENPDVIAQLEPVAGRDYYARLLTQLAADAAPDVMQIGDDAVPSFVGSGAFVPLDECIAANDFDTGIYLPGLLEPGQVDGQQYLLPKDYSPLAVYYNKALFDAAGVPYPSADWTWDDLRATAEALTDPEQGIYGIQLPATWTTGFEYWVAAAGGSLISPDGTSFVGYMDSPEAIRALEFYADLYNSQVAPPPADFNQFGGGNAEFDNGKAAMRLFGRWPQAGMLENPNIDLGVINPPADAQRANILFWGGFGVASTSENPDTACKFLLYYVGEPGAQVWKDWALPAVASVAEEAGVTTDPINGIWIGELEHIVPRAYTFTPYWNESADPALRKALETVLIDPEADPAAVMQQAAQEAQAALDALAQ